MRSFNANFTAEKNKRADGPMPINLLKFAFSGAPAYISDRDITPDDGPAHLGIVKSWGFVDTSITRTPGSGVLGSIDVADLQLTLINSTTPRFSSNFTDEDPPENVVVELYQWFGGTSYDDKEIIFKGVITGGVKYDERACTLTVRGIFDRYNIQIGADMLITPEDFPDADWDDYGKMQNIIYGACFNVPCHAIVSGDVTNLLNDIDESQYAIEVSDASYLPESGVVGIDAEQISYESHDATMLYYCTRGYNSTTATTHAAGAACWEERSEFVYQIAGHPVKAIGDIFVDGRRITSVCTKYTGQTGNELTGWEGRAVFTVPYRLTRQQAIDLILHDGLTIDDQLTVDSTLDVSSDLDIDKSGDVTKDGTVSKSGNVYLDGGVSLDGGVTMTGGVSLDGGVTMTGGVSKSGTVSIMGGVTKTGEVKKSGLITHDIGVSDGLTVDDDIEVDPGTQVITIYPTGGNADLRDGNEHSYDNISGTPYVTFPNTSYGTIIKQYVHFSASPYQGTPDITCGVYGKFGQGWTPVNISSSLDGIFRARVERTGGDWDDGIYFTGTHANIWEVWHKEVHYIPSDPKSGGAYRSGDITRSGDIYDGTDVDDSTLDVDDSTLDVDDSTLDVDDSTLGVDDSTLAANDSTLGVDDSTLAANDSTLAIDASTLDVEDGITISNTLTYTLQGGVTQTGEVSKGGYVTRSGAVTLSGNSVADVRVGKVVTCNVEGWQDDGDGTYTGTPYALIERPDHVFRHIWGALIGASLDDFTEYSAAGSFYAANSYKFSLLINKPVQAADLLMRLALQCRSRFFVTAYGAAKLMVRQLGQTSGHAIPNVEIKRDSMSVERSPATEVINQLNVYFDRDLALEAGDAASYYGAWNFTNETSIGRYGRKDWQGDETLFMFDAVTDPVMAQSVGEFIVDYHCKARRMPKFGVFLDNMEIEPGDIIDITYPLDNMSGFTTEVQKLLHHIGNAKQIDYIDVVSVEN